MDRFQGKNCINIRKSNLNTVLQIPTLLIWIRILFFTLVRIRIMLLTLIRICIRLFGMDPDPYRFKEVMYLKPVLRNRAILPRFRFQVPICFPRFRFRFRFRFWFWFRLRFRVRFWFLPLNFKLFYDKNSCWLP